MQPATKLEFDIANFKKVMEEAPSPDNGWAFEYEGIIDKNFPGTSLKNFPFLTLFRFHNENLQ